MNRMTREQLLRDFHESTHYRHVNLFRLITRLTTRGKR